MRDLKAEELEVVNGGFHKEDLQDGQGEEHTEEEDVSGVKFHRVVDPTNP